MDELYDENQKLREAVASLTKKVDYYKEKAEALEKVGDLNKRRLEGLHNRILGYAVDNHVL